MIDFVNWIISGGKEKTWKLIDEPKLRKYFEDALNNDIVSYIELDIRQQSHNRFFDFSIYKWMIQYINHFPSHSIFLFQITLTIDYGKIDFQKSQIPQKVWFHQETRWFVSRCRHFRFYMKKFLSKIQENPVSANDKYLMESIQIIVQLNDRAIAKGFSSVNSDITRKKESYLLVTRQRTKSFCVLRKCQLLTLWFWWWMTKRIICRSRHWWK